MLGAAVVPVRLCLALHTQAGGGVRRVLLLNVTYEPLTTVGLRRAVCLVLGDKAEVVHDDSEGALLRSTSLVLVMPSVIRLRRYVRVPHRSRIPLTRGALMRRDNYLCAYCTRRAARPALAADRGHVRRRPPVGRLPGRAERRLTRPVPAVCRRVTPAGAGRPVPRRMRCR